MSLQVNQHIREYLTTNLRVIEEGKAERALNADELEVMTDAVDDITSTMNEYDELKIDGSIFTQGDKDSINAEAVEEWGDRLVQAIDWEITKLPPEDVAGHQYWMQFKTFVEKFE